jgi:hypothetical protein
MSTYKLHRFAYPEVLKRIARPRLIELLAPYRTFFEGRKLLLPAQDELLPIDYPALVDVLMSPGDDMPDLLLEALYFIHELSTDEAMDSFLEDTEILTAVGENPTPADVAVFVWLHNRETLEKKHAEASLLRPRSFDHFLAKKSDGADRFDKEQLKALEAALDQWFLKRKRGRGCRVLDYPRDDEVWFLVRHGAPYRREGSLVEGESASVFYRPEKFDVLVYSATLGELRISAPTKSEKEIYRELLGLHLFGSSAHFPSCQKYTLEPLREDGQAALVCSDIEGLDWIKLIEIQYFWPGTVNEVEIRRSDDIFAALEARRAGIREKARIMRAKFKVKFTESRTPRVVTVRPPNVAQYTRDDDSELIEAWLSRRGFIRNGGES